MTASETGARLGVPPLEATRHPRVEELTGGGPQKRAHLIVGADQLGTETGYEGPRRAPNFAGLERTPFRAPLG